jgi:hypothetical protein
LPEGQPIRETELRAVRFEQRIDFPLQRLVPTSRCSQERCALGRWPFDGRLKQGLDLLPARVGHG